MPRNPLLLLCVLSGSALTQAPLAATPGPFAGTDSLTLETALERVLQTHPALEAGRSAVSARAAALEQAGRGPNPEWGVEIEDFAGTGALRGVDEAQTTFQLSHTLEGRGKRAGRRGVAEAEGRRAEAGLRSLRADLRAMTRLRFSETLVAQWRLALAEESALLARQLLDAVARRVKEGAASAADELRARLAASEARLELRQDSLRLASARHRLALLLGGEGLALPPLRGDADALPAEPPGSGPQALDRSPQAALRAEDIRVAEARVQQQQSLAGADVSLSAGLRHAAGPGALAWVGGVSMPLPIRNRNRGGTEEARHDLARARAEAQASRQALQAEAAALLQAMAEARAEAEALRDTLIPDAERAAQVLDEGYRRGRFGVLEVLSAKGELFRHRTRSLDAYFRYQQGLAEWERLTGAGDAPEGK